MAKTIVITGIILEPVNLFDLFAFFVRYRVIVKKKATRPTCKASTCRRQVVRWVGNLSFLTLIQNQLVSICGELFVFLC